MSENQNEIAPGRTFSSPGAAKVDAAEAYNATTGVGVAEQKRIDRDRATAAKAKEADDAATPAQKRVKAANANPALWDQKHPDHQKARKELLDAIAADATQDERDAYANLPIAELRDRFRLKAPRIPSNLTWNQEGRLSTSSRSTSRASRPKRFVRSTPGTSTPAWPTSAGSSRATPTVHREAHQVPRRRRCGRLTSSSTSPTHPPRASRARSRYFVAGSNAPACSRSSSMTRSCSSPAPRDSAGASSRRSRGAGYTVVRCAPSSAKPSSWRSEENVPPIILPSRTVAALQHLKATLRARRRRRRRRSRPRKGR